MLRMATNPRRRFRLLRIDTRTFRVAKSARCHIARKRFPIMTSTALTSASGPLATAQTVLFDGGRLLLTAAVILFLGYAIFIVSALLLSAIRATAHSAWSAVFSSTGRHVPQTSRTRVGAHS